MRRRDQLFASTEITERLKRGLLNSPTGYRLSRRPYQLVRFAARVPHDPDYRAFRFLAEPGESFLDLGANSGTSAMSYALFNTGPILSIEANPQLRSDLVFAARLLRGQMTFRLAGAGSEPGTLRFFVPHVNGVPISAEGSFNEAKVRESDSLAWRVGEGGDSQIEIREQPVDVVTVDSMGLSPDIVKLDVERHEHEVLLGMRETLGRSRPLLLIEAPEDDVRELLAGEGYAAYAYDQDADRLVGEHEVSDAINTFFVHPERPRRLA